jgi:hypothetical protein
MPFKIIKTPNNKYKLKNIKTGVIVNKLFNSKASAGRMGVNYMAYRGEQGKIIGNKILKK